jgi:hypothetical protein
MLAPMKLALQIAAGIVIATLMLWLLSLLMVGAAASHVGGEITKMMEQQTARAAARAERDRALQHDAALARRQAEAASAEADRRHAVELAAAAEAQEAKERAWLDFYRSPADCERPPSWEAQVECGNHYMRAKAEFDEQWNDPR